MVVGNGAADWQKRYDRMEDIVSGLVQHSQITDEHLDLADRRIELLQKAQLETNASVPGLIGAIRDLTDRIPPQNLR